MAPPSYLLVLDQGSTSSRAVLYNRAGRIAYLHRTPVTSLIPGPDRVEHDPIALLDSQRRALRGALNWLGKGGERKIAAIGITNQRSTFLLWDRTSGKPLGRAISWQDRRGADLCARMVGHQKTIQLKTGLRLTPHSTIGKLHWVMRHAPNARKKAEAGDLCFGTVNTYLIWQLTRGRVHATDHTNASRTLMMNLQTRTWDPALLSLFSIPEAMLPEIRPTAAWYGEARLGKSAVPIFSSIGDQQASLVGQGGYRPGHMALTYGTGGFMLWNIGARPQQKTTLLSTIAWSSHERVDYALEGTVNAVGSAILWLKNNLGLISTPQEIDTLCRLSREETVVVPSLSGLGSPHYAPVETTFFGLNRKSTRADLVRGVMAGIGYLMKDNYEQMRRERRTLPRTITAGGGAAQCRWLLQYQADILQKSIARSNVYETTSRGAAYLAGLHCGFWKSLDELDRLTRPAMRFRPTLPAPEVKRSDARWQQALRLAKNWTETPPNRAR